MPRPANRPAPPPSDINADAGTGIVATRENVGALLDAVRQARRMASEAGASYHGVFLAARGLPNGGMTACFDGDFPATSGLTRMICGKAGIDWLATCSHAMTPSWWLCETGAAQCPAFPLLAFAAPSPVLTPSLPGIALPVFADGGIAGFMVLAGRELMVDDRLLCDLHIRAFPLFGAVARLRVVQTADLKAVSRRELECLRLTAEGNTSESIAEKLGLSVHTANQYLTAGTQKLNAVNRMHAVAKALRLGLID